MKSTKHVKFLFVLALSIFFGGMIIFESCQDKKTGNDSDSHVVTGIIIPQDFPAGINFPVSQDTIYQWLSNTDTVSITNHAWDIWAGLTANSNQVLEGDTLMVFETWLGVKELADFCRLQKEFGATLKEKKARTTLNVPRQFSHALLLLGNAVDTSKGFNIYETVSYNNAAAAFATTKLIFRESVIKQYWKDGNIGAIPVFPNDAITTKPTYYAGKADSITGMIRVPTWPGVPQPLKVYPPSKWGTYVLVDTNNQQPAGKVAVPINVDAPTQAQIAAATVNLNDFINFRIDADMAKYLNKHQDVGNAQFVAGDFVMLVGMHVGTKEISNWTWQTFFWSPDPKNPIFPSSSFAANLMPSNLNGAASHYAVATAYAMVWPNQPVNGGSNATSNTPIIAFNPYLEAALTGLNQGQSNSFRPNFQYGVQTNCMTCHALAAQQFGNGKAANYSTDQYISMNDTNIFKSQVQLDFAWSVQGNIIKGK